MVTLAPKPEHLETIRMLVGAQQQRVTELRQVGILE